MAKHCASFFAVEGIANFMFLIPNFKFFNIENVNGNNTCNFASYKKLVILKIPSAEITVYELSNKN